MIRWLLFLSISGLILPACQSQFPRKFRLPDTMYEVSGLYAAGPDSLWWLNDGGSPAELYLTDRNGHLLETVEVPGALNRDWEDLTADDRGQLYIGDFGNNFNQSRDLRIYIYGPATNEVDSILFHYPDQTEFPPVSSRASFNMEGFFWHRDSLHLFSKNHLHGGNFFTKHYILPARPGTYEAELRDSLYLKKRVVTGSAISPDGQTVVLLTYWMKRFFGFIPLTPATVFVLEDYPGTDFLQGALKRRKTLRCVLPTQYETVDFGSEGWLILASERTILYKQKGRRLRLKRGKGK